MGCRLDDRGPKRQHGHEVLLGTLLSYVRDVFAQREAMSTRKISAGQFEGAEQSGNIENQ